MTTVFYNRIKVLAKEKGYTTDRALARAAGIPEPNLYRIKHSSTRLTFSVATKLKNALGISYDELYHLFITSQKEDAHALRK